MDPDLDRILGNLTGLAEDLAKGDYESSKRLFDYTQPGSYPERITGLAESMSMMAIKIEAREFRLEQIIKELKETNQALEASLQKIRLLENIQTHLRKFVPESVKRIIEAAPEDPDLDKHDSDISVLFLDIAGYTRMSETVEVERMNYLVERYFSSFLDDIYENRGDINETAGDGLMILFQHAEPGVHARNAVRTAVAIQKKVGLVNATLAGQYPPVTINVGINSGTAAIGSTRFQGIAGTRWTYTASGPMTNIAARIGSLAKSGEVLIGDETAGRVGGDFSIRPIGEHALRNVERPVSVFEVLLDTESK